MPKLNIVHNNLFVFQAKPMVQNETNEGIQISHQAKIPSAVSGSNPTTYQLRLFENINILSEGSGEKKKKVGNYIISKTIGEGSFAKVRLGFHIPTQQKVILLLNKNNHTSALSKTGAYCAYLIYFWRLTTQNLPLIDRFPSKTKPNLVLKFFAKL